VERDKDAEEPAAEDWEWEKLVWGGEGDWLKQQGVDEEGDQRAHVGADIRRSSERWVKRWRTWSAHSPRSKPNQNPCGLTLVMQRAERVIARPNSPPAWKVTRPPQD